MNCKFRIVETSTAIGIVGLAPPASAGGNGVARRSYAQTSLVSDISKAGRYIFGV